MTFTIPDQISGETDNIGSETYQLLDELSEYSFDARRSILRGLTQKATISRGSFGKKKKRAKS